MTACIDDLVRVVSVLGFKLRLSADPLKFFKDMSEDNSLLSLCFFQSYLLLGGTFTACFVADQPFPLTLFFHFFVFYHKSFECRIAEM